ncbi:MAG: Panacea domain-containing protein [Bosea sp. (in: a-proteobacteria)]
MTLSLDAPPKLTWKIDLEGGQRRLQEAILYVAKQCQSAPSFGLIKLNKILWRADFVSFAERGQPVTGRQYQRLPQGPAPVEMKPVLNEMLRAGLIRIELARVINYDERRVTPLTEPSLAFFTKGDLDQLDRSIFFYWEKNGRETSDQSHGAAWRTREDGDSMPYELAYLSDEPLSVETRNRLLNKAQARGLRSL